MDGGHSDSAAQSDGGSDSDELRSSSEEGRGLGVDSEEFTSRDEVADDELTSHTDAARSESQALADGRAHLRTEAELRAFIQHITVDESPHASPPLTDVERAIALERWEAELVEARQQLALLLSEQSELQTRLAVQAERHEAAQSEIDTVVHAVREQISQAQLTMAIASQAAQQAQAAQQTQAALAAQQQARDQQKHAAGASGGVTPQQHGQVAEQQRYHEKWLHDLEGRVQGLEAQGQQLYQQATAQMRAIAMQVDQQRQILDNLRSQQRHGLEMRLKAVEAVACAGQQGEGGQAAASSASPGAPPPSAAAGSGAGAASTARVAAATSTASGDADAAPAAAASADGAAAAAAAAAGTAASAAAPADRGGGGGVAEAPGYPTRKKRLAAVKTRISAEVRDKP